MINVLITAFEAYQPWSTNASWLALMELTKSLPTSPRVTTRLYPVDLPAMKDRLVVDLKSRYDIAIHLGQAPQSSCIQLEEVAINACCSGPSLDQVESPTVVCPSGPAAFRCSLPLSSYAMELRGAGIPTRVSRHAGTYLCNAIYYWSCRLAEELELPTKSMFIHIPLETSQVLRLDQPAPFMSSEMVADALRVLLPRVCQDVQCSAA